MNHRITAHVLVDLEVDADVAPEEVAALLRRAGAGAARALRGEGVRAQAWSASASPVAADALVGALEAAVPGTATERGP